MVICTPCACTGCCRSNHACWHKMTQWCAATIPILCSHLCLDFCTQIKYSSICTRQATIYRTTHEDKQCSHHRENSVYALEGRIVSLHPGSFLVPIPEFLIHCSICNSSKNMTWMTASKKIPNDILRGKILQWMHIHLQFFS